MELNMFLNKKTGEQLLMVTWKEKCGWTCLKVLHNCSREWMEKTCTQSHFSSGSKPRGAHSAGLLRQQSVPGLWLTYPSVKITLKLMREKVAHWPRQVSPNPCNWVMPDWCSQSIRTQRWWYSHTLHQIPTVPSQHSQVYLSSLSLLNILWSLDLPGCTATTFRYNKYVTKWSYQCIHHCLQLKYTCIVCFHISSIFWIHLCERKKALMLHWVLRAQNQIMVKHWYSRPLVPSVWEQLCLALFG